MQGSISWDGGAAVRVPREACLAELPHAKGTTVSPMRRCERLLLLLGISRLHGSEHHHNNRVLIPGEEQRTPRTAVHGGECHHGQLWHTRHGQGRLGGRGPPAAATLLRAACTPTRRRGLHGLYSRPLRSAGRCEQSVHICSYACICTWLLAVVSSA